jgi:hypothetical protein
VADTTGNFQDLLQFSGDTLYNLGEEFVIGNSLATSISFGMSNSAGVLMFVGEATANATVSLPNSGTVLTAVNVSAGTTSNYLSAVTFSNSNGVSFGLNGSVITASASPGAAAGIGAIAAGTQTATSGTIVFSNSNGVSFGMSASSVLTASHALNLSAGTTSANLSAVTFSNSNGVLFGLNAGTVTASVPASVPVRIEYNPSIPSSGNSVATWAEVMAAVAASAAPITIIPISPGLLVANYCHVPAGGPYNMNFAIIEGYQDTALSSIFGVLQIDVGAQLLNLGGIRNGGYVYCVNTSMPSLVFDASNPDHGSIVFFLSMGGRIDNTGSYPIMETNVTGSTSIIIEVDNDGFFFMYGTGGGLTFLNLTGTGQNVYLVCKSMTLAGAPLQANWLTGGDATANLFYYVDTDPFCAGPTNSAFLGTTTSFYLLGGPTASMPSAPPAFWTYYDTTLKQFLVYDGTTWNRIGPSPAIAAGTQTATSGTVVFSNSNNVSFGMSNSSVVTASAQINVSAGTTSNNLSAITFSNSNGVSFGLNGSTVTARYGGFSNWQNGAPVTTFGSSGAFLSFQPIIVPYAITVTNVLFLASLSQGTASSASSGGYKVSFGLYTLNVSTLSLASSASSSITWTSGNAYSSVSGVGYRPVSVASWALTPGPYIFGIALASTVLSSISLTLYGTASFATIGASGQGTMFSTMPWSPGFSTSSVAALPASYAVSNTASIVRTGSSIFQQPWISFQGT